MDHFDPAGEAENQPIPEGTMIAGRYRIVRPLGTGGMGSVYLAADRVLGDERIAIKILHTGYVHDETQLARFRREVQLMRKVNHKNVVRTYDVGTDQQYTYFTMEFIPGTQLEKLIADRTLPKDKVVNYMLQIAEALQAIHSANIIHRDLKPGNILILDDGTLRITDFGVARPEISNLTAHDEIVGSVCYIAPEVWIGQKISPAADLYALGVILYEMLTGKVPFDGESPAALMRAHLDRAPIPPKTLIPAIPTWLNKLNLKLLAKSAADRPKDAREIIEYIKLHSGDHTGDGSGGQSVQPFINDLETHSRVLTTVQVTDPPPLTTTHPTMNVMKRVVGQKSSAGGLPQYAPSPKSARELPGRIFSSVFWAGSLLLFTGMLQLALNRIFPHFATQLTDTQLVEQASSFASLGFRATLVPLVPNVLVFLLQLSVPAALIGGAAGSKVHAIRSMLVAFIILSLSFAAIAGYFLLGAPTKEHITALSILSATATAKDLVSSVALLSPVTNVYDQVILGDGLVQSAHTVVPLFRSPLVLGCLLFYASFLAVALYRTSREVRGTGSAIPGIMIFLLVACVNFEAPFFREITLTDWAHYWQFSLRIAPAALAVSAAHWGFVFILAFFATRRPIIRRRSGAR